MSKEITRIICPHGSVKKIAEHFGIRVSTVCRILGGYRMYADSRREDEIKNYAMTVHHGVEITIPDTND